MSEIGNQIYAWGRVVGESGIKRLRIAVERDTDTNGMCLSVADDAQLVLDDATAIALAGMLTGGDLADDIYRAAKALQAREGSEATSAYLRRVADGIDERPEWTRKLK